MVMVSVFVLGAGFPAMAQAAAQSAACQPGSGPDLAGKTITSGEVSDLSGESLQCANLTDANLSGLSLDQIDITGADLRGANLQNTDLTQATLNGADFQGANLAGATLDQSEAQGADFRDADLSGASAVQTDLTGANLDDASLGGADFSQATFSGTAMTGVTGIFPWSLCLLLAAALIFVVSAWKALTRARRLGSRRAQTGVALAGCLVLACGFYLFGGGIIDEFIGQMTGAPIAQACSGPLCRVGVASGFYGLPVGIVVMLIGASLRNRRDTRKVSIA